ncbi:MAG: ATP-binding protein [Candidatus Korobacteraceae bacterium]|jgi:signal transduction histidine kinase
MDTETNHQRAGHVPDLPSLCHSIFEGSSLPMAMLAGAEHIVSYVNPAFGRFVGRDKDELAGIPFAEVVPGDGCLSLLDRVYRTGEAESHTEQEPSSGHTLYWSYAMWPVLGADKHPVGVMFRVTETASFHQQATAMNQELLLSAVRQHELTEAAERLNAQLQREMSERKLMERALLDSAKLAATARLASTMAHEINNPLDAITNLVYLLAPLQTTPEAQAYIATLDQQLRGLTRIATQMLKFNRDSNRPTEFKLEELIRELLDFYRPQAERQGIVVIQRLESEGSVLGFRSEIIQVVTNLLLNALEASSSGKKVIVHLYPAPPWLCSIHNRYGYCLSVADTGRGIDPQSYKRIFAPFFTTKGDKGTGLGLWLCMGIVNRAGGSIRVWSSRRPGRSGTCFSVFLPVEEGAFTPLRRRYERQNSTCQPKEQSRPDAESV